MVKIILHGFLKEEYPSFEVDAETAAEAISAWSNQTKMAKLPMDARPIIDAVGFETLEKLNAPLAAKEIHLVPRMFGGGGSFGKILLGAALIGLAMWNPIGASVMVVTMVGGTGLSLMLGGIMQMFMKTPSVDSSNDPEASKYLGSGNNTTKIGTLIPRGYGRFIVAGQYLSIQVNSSDMVFGKFPETL